jgi:hypothetical protein
MWGLKDLFDGETENPIPGVADLEEVVTDDACGFILTNRLDYVLKAMPPGWENTVQQKASNRIMAQEAKQMEKQMGVEVPRLAQERQRRARRGLAAEWRRWSKAR